MKKLHFTIFIVLLLVSFNVKAQDDYLDKKIAKEIKYSDLTSPTSNLTNYTYASYLSKDGAVYKVGDKITVGNPSSNKTFAFITSNQGSGWHLLTTSSVGDQIEIKKIEVIGNTRSGYKVLFSNNRFMNSYQIVIENAIASGEVKSFGVSSDEALTNLKRAKDKLDLGLISQQKYDSIKTELVKYIK